MTTTARKPRATLSKDERHRLLHYLIVMNAVQYGRGDGHARIARDASSQLGLKLNRGHVQRGNGHLQAIGAVPFVLRKRRPLRGSPSLISRSWAKVEALIRTNISGKVIAEGWTLRTVQRYVYDFDRVRIGLEPLAATLKLFGYEPGRNGPDSPIYLSDGTPAHSQRVHFEPGKIKVLDVPETIIEVVDGGAKP